MTNLQAVYYGAVDGARSRLNSEAHAKRRQRVLKRGPSGADTIIFRRGEQIMVTTYTNAGTPIIDMSDDEYRAFLDHEVRERIGLSLEEFVARANAGEIDWDHPEAFALAGLVGVGESGLIASASSNGHRPAA